MKKAILLSVALIMIICVSTSLTNVKALNSGEWSWTYALDKTTYYQGDSGTVTITFTSNCPDQLQFSSVSVQFDWTTTPTSETVSSPNIATGNQYTFPAIAFSIPSDATVGYHSFTVTIQGQQKELLGWTNISPTGPASNSIYVHDAYEKVYNGLVPTVQNSLTNAQNGNFCPDALALLQQANTMYNEATSLSQQGQWQSAVNDLNSASNYVSQALALPTPTPIPTPTPTAPITYNLDTPSPAATSIPEFPAIEVLAIFLMLTLFAVSILVINKRKVIKI